MKTLKKCISATFFVAFILLQSLPIQAKNGLFVNELQIESNLNRLHEINKMDKSHLDAPQRLKLLNEVKGINKAMKTTANGGGVYLSVGAIIIIALLLIILL